MALASEAITPAEFPVLEVRGISKSFDVTQAVKSVELRVSAGEIVGIVGHNGAGKSTLVKLIAGLVVRDAGTVVFGGVTMPPQYSIRMARARGFSLALQEISLCPDLRVEENIGIAHPMLIGPGWRRRARGLIGERLSAIFPGHGISTRAIVGRLSLAQRQMVQIALATISPGAPLRLLMLDEPSSALPDQFSDSLFAYLRTETQAGGMSVLLVSHKMADILGSHTDRTVVMRDGAVAGEYSSGGLAVETIIECMGGVPSSDLPAADNAPAVVRLSRGRSDAGDDVLSIRDLNWKRLTHVSLSVGRGQIVGLAGLEGNGQRDILDAVWRARRRALIPSRLHRAVKLSGRTSFLSGDRQNEGIFPFWPLRANLTLSILRRLSVLGILSPRAEDREASEWISRLSIRGAAGTPILELSGGTQQKVLLGRGLATNPELLLLDDPFRGVDVMTKMDAYRRLHAQAEGGTSMLWYTSENIEMLECDVVHVLRSGAVVATLSAEELSVGRMIAASFEGLEGLEEVVGGPAQP